MFPWEEGFFFSKLLQYTTLHDTQISDIARTPLRDTRVFHNAYVSSIRTFCIIHLPVTSTAHIVIVSAVHRLYTIYVCHASSHSSSSIICRIPNGLIAQLPKAYFCLPFAILDKAVTWRRAVWYFKELPACINNLESSAYFLVGEDPSRAGGRIDVTSGNRNLQVRDEGRIYLNLQTNTTNRITAQYMAISRQLYSYIQRTAYRQTSLLYTAMDTTTTTARCCSEHKACQWLTEGGGVQSPPFRNFEGPPKSCQAQPHCENC